MYKFERRRNLTALLETSTLRNSTISNDYRTYKPPSRRWGVGSQPSPKYLTWFSHRRTDGGPSPPLPFHIQASRILHTGIILSPKGLSFLSTPVSSPSGIPERKC